MRLRLMGSERVVRRFSLSTGRETIYCLLHQPITDSLLRATAMVAKV